MHDPRPPRLNLRSVLVLASDAPADLRASLADAWLVDLHGAEPGRGARETMLARVGASEARPPLLVRVGPIDSGGIATDLADAMPLAPAAVVLRRTIGARDVAHLGAKLAVWEAQLGWPHGSTRIVAQPADSAAAVLALPHLPGASTRLAALLWDPHALAAELRLDPASEPVRHARSMLLIAARAGGVPALDGNLSAPLEPGSHPASRRTGFSGRLVADPAEIDAVNAAFDG